MKNRMTKIISTLLLVCILVSTVILTSCSDKTVDFMEMNLGKYISLKADGYKNYEVTITVPEPNEQDVKDAIVSVLAENKNTEDEDGYAFPTVINTVIGAGDIVNINYVGYMLNDLGEKTFFSGGSNITSSASSLEIGSGQFVSGFESNLVGVNTADYARLKVIKSSSLKDDETVAVLATDTIKFTYKVNGSSTSSTATANLADLTLDSTWGEGFRAFFTDSARNLGTTYGKTDYVEGTSEETDKPLYLTAPGSSTQSVYHDIKVTEIYRAESGKPVLTVDAYFPYEYPNNTALQNKHVKFDVFVSTVQDFTVPNVDENGNITEKFIEETLGLTAEDLKDYEGDGLVAKYTSKIKADLAEVYAEQINEQIEEAFYANALKNAKFKDVSNYHVNLVYNNAYNVMNSTYSSYGYTTLEAYGKAFFGISNTDTTTNWLDLLREYATEEVKKQTIFYYVLREEGFIPDDATKSALVEEIYNESWEEYVEENSIDIEDENELKEAKEAFEKQYTAYVLESMAIEEYAREQIRGLAKTPYNYDEGIQDK